MIEDGQDLEALALPLEASGSYKVLRRLVPCPKYKDGGDNKLYIGAVVDVETTGKVLRSDVIIELSLVSFSYNAVTGGICSVNEPLKFFEDPGRPLPQEITDLTGIRDEDGSG